MSVRFRIPAHPHAAARATVLACGLVFALGAAAQARAPAPEPDAIDAPAHHMPPPLGAFAPPLGAFADGVPPYLRGIELTEAQRDKIFALTHAQAPAQREQFKALDQARRDLHALVFKGPYDEAKARALADAAARAQAESLLARARIDAQILQSLTPEQRKQLDEARREPGGPQERPAPGRPGSVAPEPGARDGAPAPRR